jgi:NADH-quinone oxidoreductase subunit N
VVGAYYYLRIVKLMWFDEATGEFARIAGELRLVFGLSGLFVTAYVLFGGPVGNAANAAAKSFF